MFGWRELKKEESLQKRDVNIIIDRVLGNMN